MTLSLFRERFQPIFEHTLRQHGEACVGLIDDAFLQSLTRYPERLGAQGKRIRPYTAWLMVRACGGDDHDDLLRILTSLELFHLFALVHDDIIDRGAIRHGVPTVHQHAAEVLRAAGRQGDIARIADAQAMLVGDLLFNWSHASFDAPSRLSPDHLYAARTVFRAMIDEVIIGQILDVDLTTRTQVTGVLIEQKMRLKTAGYTFIRPLQLGLALACDHTDTSFGERHAWCERFGAALGTAFQIQDDELDLVSTNEQSGKSVQSDTRERQHTVFTQWIVEHGTDADRRALAALQDAPEDSAHARALFESSGALAYGRERCRTLMDEATQLAAAAPVETAFRRAFCDIVTFIRRRSA